MQCPKNTHCISEIKVHFHFKGTQRNCFDFGLLYIIIEKDHNQKHRIFPNMTESGYQKWARKLDFGGSHVQRISFAIDFQEFELFCRITSFSTCIFSFKSRNLVHHPKCCYAHSDCVTSLRVHSVCISVCIQNFTISIITRESNCCSEWPLTEWRTHLVTRKITLTCFVLC